MDEIKEYTYDDKAQLLRQSIIDTGYGFAAYQDESMSEDLDNWKKIIIEGRINPKYIDIDEQAGHAVDCDGLDYFMDLDYDVFPEARDFEDINDFFEHYGISYNVIFELLEIGKNKYIAEEYGCDWEDKYPDPIYPL